MNAIVLTTCTGTERTKWF